MREKKRPITPGPINDNDWKDDLGSDKDAIRESHLEGSKAGSV